MAVAEVATVGGRLRLLPPAVVVGLILGAVKALTCLSTSPVVVVVLVDVVVVEGLGRGRGITADDVDVDGGGNGFVDTVTACFGGDFNRESKRMSFWIFWTSGDTCGTFLFGEKDRRVDSTTGFPRGLDLVLPLDLTLLLPCSLVDSRTGAPRGFRDLPFFKTGLGGSSWKGGEASWSTA